MSKKFIYLLSFVLILVLAANAPAAETRVWDGGGGANRLWDLPANWVGDIVPTAAEHADIDINDANCLIDASVTATCRELSVGKTKGPCYLFMTDGNLTTTSVFNIGDEPDSNGFFIMSGGNVSTGGAHLYIGDGSNTAGKNPAYGTLIISGGELNVGNKIYLSKNSTGNSWMYVDGGTINTVDDFEIGQYGNGYLEITAGDVNCGDALKMSLNGDSASGGTSHIEMLGGTILTDSLRMNPDGINPEGGQTSTINLFGGTIQTGDIFMGMGAVKPVIDITDGNLIVEEDAELPEIYQHIANGWIIGYGGLGKAEVDTSGGVITVTARLVDPNLATEIYPDDYATIDWTAAGPTLSWQPGAKAVTHDVYFGTDSDDVNDANNSPGVWPEFKGNKSITTYDTNQLSVGTTYYWRIDEVNNLNTTWKGDVWEFSVQDYVIVDDMDQYGDDATKPWVPGGRIYFVCRDARYVGELGDLSFGNSTGAQIGYYNGLGTDISESTIVRSGLSMPFYYENDGAFWSKPVPNYSYTGLMYYSETCARTTGDNSLADIDTNWAVQNVEALSLWFHGDPDNDPNILNMYVALGDSDSNAVVYYTGDINDIKKAEWQEWNIPLSSFTDVTLTDVRRIYIGLGERGNVTTKSGKGIMFFDDIRLYPPRCVSSILQPEADLDDDCDVDYDDLDVMTGDWLESDYNGVGHDGVLTNFPSDNSQWVVDPCRGKCLSFDGIDDWVDIDDREFSNFQDKTISLWVNIKEFAADYPYVFCFQNAEGPTSYRIYLRTRSRAEANSVRVHFVEDYSKDFNDVPDTWNHLAFVLTNTGSDTCTGEFYADGALIDSMPGRPRHTGGAKGVNLGSFNDGQGGYLKALYDEFRVYDAALSAADIGYLAGLGGSPPTANMLLHYDFNDVSGKIAKNSSSYVFYCPLLSVSELYDSEPLGPGSSRWVNFRDFAILAADDWLKDPMLWP